MIERTAACQNPTPDGSTTTINRLVAENTNLRRKLQTQPVIEQAKGILMARHGVSADEAFEMLSKWSQDGNLKLHLVARSITAHRGRGHQPGSMKGRGSGPAAASTVSLCPTAAPHQELHSAAIIPFNQTGTLVTAIDSGPATAKSHWVCLLPGEVMDALADSPAAGVDRVARAEAMNSTVREIFEMLAWGYAENADADELASMRRVIDEAQAHLDRMRAQSTAH